jgi:homocysteine S-methyltransferase
MRERPVLLDGGLATQLESAGHDLSDELWSARLLVDDPDAIVAAHRAFLDAGASVVTTASYQATLAGFQRRGLSAAEAGRLLRRSVELARRATESATENASDRPLWIAASIGPYGAALADGSEYRGNYGISVADLIRFHRPRLEILAEAGPDVFALETVPDVREAEAMVAALDGIGIPAWLSYTVAAGRTRAGQSLADAGAVAAGRNDVIAVGVNCSAPPDAAAALTPLAQASGKPGVSYPNSGETWDARIRQWVGDPSGGTDAAVTSARLVGGCCRVNADAIAALARSLPGR